MAARTKTVAATAAAEHGVLVFAKQGKTDNRVALNTATGVVIEEDGAGKYFLFVHGRQFPVVSEQTLEELVGLPPADSE